jgi:ABC-type bacteriocin/lantibiotic exporter with double-glycine peptidase domain
LRLRFSCIVLAVIAARNVSAERKPACGAHCLYVALLALDIEIDSLDALEDDLGPPPARGYSLGQLAQAARAHGVDALGVSTSLDRLASRGGRFAVIAHWGDEHFVNVGGIGANGVTFADGAVVRTIPPTTFNTQWDGNALLLSRDPLLPEEQIVVPDSDQWRQWSLWAGVAAAATFLGIQWSRRRTAGV